MGKSSQDEMKGVSNYRFHYLESEFVKTEKGMKQCEKVKITQESLEGPRLASSRHNPQRSGKVAGTGNTKEAFSLFGFTMNSSPPKY